MRKQIIKTLALVLVFALILSAAAPPKAAAVISEGLLIAAAIALTMGTCVAITMIAADSAGMTGAIQVAAEKGLQDTAEFTEKLIRGFNEARGMLFTQFLLMMAKGARITRDGALALGEEVSAWLTDFFDWAWSEDGGNLVASAVSDNLVASSGLVTNKPSWFSNFGSVNLSGSASCTYNSNTEYVFSGAPYFFWSNVSGATSVYWLRAVSDSSFSVYRNGVLRGDARLTTYQGFSYYFYDLGQYNFAYYSDFSPAGTTLQTNTGATIPSVAYTILGGYVEGEIEEPDTNVLQLPAEGAIDTNILNIPDQLVLPPVQGTATADSYLGAVRDAIYEGTGTLDYTDANDIAGTATLEMTGTATVDQVATGAGQLEGSTEVAEGVGSPTLDNYSIDLRDFFPFCIPFDLYDMLNLMSASRAAPQVHWEFYVPGPNGMETYNLELDFSVLDPVASVLRTMELLAFGFALAIGTKKLLMGS